MKTSELTGAALDWVVAKCEGCNEKRLMNIPMWKHIRQQGVFRFSTDWAQGGPIIEREKIVINTEHGDPWRASFGRAHITFDGRAHHYHHQDGPTPLIAAMRCYCYAKLGDEIEIPPELLPSA